jgi:hypothetical protein
MPKMSVGMGELVGIEVVRAKLPKGRTADTALTCAVYASKNIDIRSSNQD